MSDQYKTIRNSIGVFFFLQGLVYATWVSRIPDIKTTLALSDAMLGAVLFAMPAGQLSAMAFSAWAVKRFESSRTLKVAAVLCPLSILPLALAPSAWVLSIGLYIFGLLTNLYNLSINTQGIDMERIYSKSILTSYQGLWSLGAIFGGGVCMALSVFGVGILHHIILISTISIATTFALRRWLIQTDIRAEVQVDKGAKTPLWRRIDNRLWLLGFITFLATLCEGTFRSWAGVFYADTLEVDPSLVNLGYVVAMCTMTAGRFVSDPLKQRYGIAFVVRACGVLTIIGFIVAAISSSLVVATIGFFILGFGISSTLPVCYSGTGDSRQLPPSVALAVVATIGAVGFLVAPPISGYLTELFGLRWTFGAVAAVGAVSVALSYKIKKI